MWKVEESDFSIVFGLDFFIVPPLKLYSLIIFKIKILSLNINISVIFIGQSHMDNIGRNGQHRS